jgi:triphosphatase
MDRVAAEPPGRPGDRGSHSSRLRRCHAGRYKKVRKRGKGFAHLSASERHQLRIGVKKLRYAVDFFGGLYEGEDTDDYSDSLGELQDDLGRQNDLAVMERRLTALTADGKASGEAQELSRAIGKVIGWHAREAALHAPDLAKRWKRLKKGKRFW